MVQAYTGPGPLTATTALTAWTLDVVAIALVAVAAVAYARGVRRVGQQGTRWPVMRVLSFAAGLALALIATCSAVGVYAPALFWMYVVQTCVLLLLVPLLLGAGAPLGLAAAASGPAGRARLDAWTSSRAGRIARLPGLGPAVLIAVTSVLFFTPLMTVALSSTAGGEAVRLGLLAAGLVVALPVTDEHVGLSSVAYAAALAFALVEFLLDAVPGIVLRLQSHVLQEGYWSSLNRPWGPTPLGDQQLAGAWLWFFAEAGDLPFIAALLVAWVRSDAREARAVDAALDAALTPEPRRRRPRRDADASPQDDPDRQRPWWRRDPSVFGEARGRRSGWGAPPSGRTSAPARPCCPGVTVAAPPTAPVSGADPGAAAVRRAAGPEAVAPEAAARHAQRLRARARPLDRGPLRGGRRRRHRAPERRPAAPVAPGRRPPAGLRPREGHARRDRRPPSALPCSRSRRRRTGASTSRRAVPRTASTATSPDPSPAPDHARLREPRGDPRPARRARRCRVT